MSARSIAFARGRASQLRAGGETVTYLPAASEPYDVDVIWSEDPGLRAQHPGIQASAFGLWADFSGEPRKNERLVRNDLVYVIVEDPREGKDDTGCVTLYLRRE